MKIAIMGAMIEEIEPLLEYFKEYKVVEYANNKFYEIRYKNLDLVIANSKIGKVFASLTATIMIEKFGCEKLLFTGVAGGISDDLKIGDLIFADKLCQHDVDITAFGHPYGFIPESEVFINTDKNLLNLADKILSKEGIKLRKGIIVTGDQFIASKDKKDWIRKTFNGDALEMEGASVAVVCNSLKIPFLILRSISDIADMDANFDFDEFLKKSAKTSSKFIISMIDELN